MRRCHHLTPLSRKLVKLFIISGLFVVITTVAIFHFFGNLPYRKTFLTNVQFYTNLIIDNYERGEISSDELKERDISLHKVDWAKAKIYIEQELDDLRFRKITDSFSVGHTPGKLVSMITRDNSVYFVTANSGADNHHFALMIVIVLIILTLSFVHRTIKRLLRPLSDIKESAIRYGDGDLDYVISSSRTREFQEVGESINEMRAKIKTMLEAKRTLLLAIGHELRTPLTRQKINCEMIKEEKRRESIQEDIEEMELIIDTLLESERSNSNQTLNLKPISLAELLDPFKIYPLEIEDGKKILNVDKAKIQLALRNITGNAKKYAGGVTQIKVQSDEETIIEVIDDGPGVDEKHFESLTEAFFRPDSSRTREKGGVGLGLYIASEVIKAHGGKLSFNNNPEGKGLNVKIIF